VKHGLSSLVFAVGFERLKTTVCSTLKAQMQIPHLQNEILQDPNIKFDEIQGQDFSRIGQVFVVSGKFV